MQQEEEGIQSHLCSWIALSYYSYAKTESWSGKKAFWYCVSMVFYSLEYMDILHIFWNECLGFIFIIEVESRGCYLQVFTFPTKDYIDVSYRMQIGAKCYNTLTRQQQDC